MLMSSWAGRGAYREADPYAYASGLDAPAGYKWDFITESGVRVVDELTGQPLVDLVAD